MADHLYATVPRLTEREPGYATAELFAGYDTGLTVSETSGQADAILEPLSRRWMGRPRAVDGTDNVSDWTSPTSSTLLGMYLASAGGWGVYVNAATDWTIRRVADLELCRGFYLDLWIYEPEASGDWTKPVTIAWGGKAAADEESPKPAKWQLVLEPNRQGPGLARLSEHDGSDYVARDPIALLTGQFFNKLHRLWFQPLSDGEWLLRNRDEAEMGAVIHTDLPVEYDPDADSETDDGPPVALAPWDTGAPEVSGTYRAWTVYRDLVFPTAWTVETNGTRDLGYTCTQSVTAAGRYWLPDGKRQQDEDGGSDYACAVDVFADALDGDAWAAGADTNLYAWRVSASGPDDADGYSKRALTLDRLELSWPPTTATDGATAVDVLTLDGVSLLGLQEARSYRDGDARLTVTLQGPVATLAPLVRPAVRWQWVVDLNDGGEGSEYPYIRFDGLRDAADAPVWRDVEDEWRMTAQVTLRNRWRQADGVLFRGQVVLDGLTRSTAYAKLAALMPLDTTEVYIVGSTLDNDAPIPSARRGEEPLWRPEIGRSLGDLLRGLQESVGGTDRLLFRDIAGTACFTVDKPGTASAAKFWRTQADADAAGVSGQVICGPDVQRLLSTAQDDGEFYNEVIVAGRQPLDVLADSGSEQGQDSKAGQLITAYYADPSSWQSATIGGVDNLRYVGVRRTLLLIDPTLATPEAVVNRALELVRQFGRFRSAGRFESYLVPSLYPGDVITVAAGTEPGAVDTDYEIRGMTTTCRGMSLTATVRYSTTYEIGEVPA